MAEEYRIISLADTGIDEILDAFQKAFCDYAVNFDRAQIEAMLERRGFNPVLSYAALVDGQIAAFTLNGTGEYDGSATCYDCGTGTRPEYRGNGLAGMIFRHSVPLLRQAGIRQYLLEVLQDNAPAISIYKANGFSISARYNCYNQTVGELRLDRSKSIEIEIQQTDCNTIRNLQGFCDFKPSWQNDIESIERGAARLNMTAAYHAGQAVGYCVSDPQSGDIAQIAVAEPFRRKGIATGLLSDAVEHFSSKTIKILNVDSDNRSLPAFLHAVNIADGLSQYAMINKL